jgi:hypothetical protein
MTKTAPRACANTPGQGHERFPPAPAPRATCAAHSIAKHASIWARPSAVRQK